MDLDLIRQSEVYKKMKPYHACEVAEGFGSGEDASQDEQQAAWQYLHDTRRAYILQGWYGRTATRYIEDGLINP